MNPLPESLDDWPRDPYDLLGVTRSSTWKEMRRAYAARIKLYKPEQFPAEFQRIRAAYELLQRWHDRPGEATESPPMPFLLNVELPAEPSPRPATPGETSARNSARPPSFAQRLEQALQLMQKGEFRAGFRELRALDTERPGTPEVCLPAFWALQIHPELVPGILPLTVLVRALQQHPHEDSIWTVCLQEVQWNRVAALSGVCRELLEHCQPSYEWKRLIVLRWQAALQQEQWELLEGDLLLLRARLELDQPRTWVELLISLVEATVWSTNPAAIKLFSQAYHELNQLPEWSLPLAGQLDQLDYLLEAVKSLPKNFERDSPDWFHLCRECWNPYSPMFQQTARTMGWEWYADPRLVHRRLVKFSTISPLVVYRLMDSLESALQYPLYLDDERAEWIRERMLDLIHELSDAEVRRRLTEELIGFCLRERVSLGALLRLCSERGEWGLERLPEWFGEDPALHIVIAGILAAHYL